MGLRKFKRSIAKAKMEQVGIVQPNKSRFKHIDNKGNPTTVHRKSFFATHWNDK